MGVLEDFGVLTSEELMDRAWDAFFATVTPISSGHVELDNATRSIADHAFRAGWLACIQQQILMTQRRSGG